MHLDFATGIISPSGHSTRRRLAHLAELFEDQEALAAMDPETVVYQTYGCPGDAPGEQLLYGTTVLMPGRVGRECFMTRGHFHTHPLRGEICLTVSGQGVLLLMDREGQTRREPMSAGSLHDIPPPLAHRVVNTGEVPLIFFVTWMSDCGHDYESIRTKGFGTRILAE
jgi:glucose-6-phosphate isomerase